MKLYELVIVLHPQLNDDELSAMHDKVSTILGPQTIQQTDNLGMRQFNHEMRDEKHLDKGFIVSHLVHIDPNNAPEIITQLNYEDKIIRHKLFAVSNKENFLIFDDIQDKAQELAEHEEWSVKKHVDIFNDRSYDTLFNRKALPLLKRFMTRFGDIKPRKYTGVSVAQQKIIRKAIINARTLGMLPFTK
jgi:ribosomal protein S18/ribosomal protein S6